MLQLYFTRAAPAELSAAESALCRKRGSLQPSLPTAGNAHAPLCADAASTEVLQVKAARTCILRPLPAF